MKISSLGRVPQQSFESGLSQKSSSASSSSRTGSQTPPMLLGRSSSHLAAQTSPLTSGSTLSRGLLSTLPKCWECTTPLMLRPSSPKTSGTSSRSLFEFPSSPKASGHMETGSLHLGKPSKQSHSPCPAGTPSMRPTKHTCQTSSPPSLPHSILGLLNSTKPSDSGLPIKSTFFASLILSGLKTFGSYTSPHLVWV